MTATKPTPAGCGTCTLCCKLLGIPELEKKPGTWCPHCAPGKGCGIYEERPTSCREFECLWLQSQKQASPFKAELRPDRVKFVLAPQPDQRTVVVHCDPGSPSAWRTDRGASILRSLVLAGMRVIVSPRPGSTTAFYIREVAGGEMVAAGEIRLSPPDALGRQTYLGPVPN